jgi:hypothetical protein
VHKTLGLVVVALYSLVALAHEVETNSVHMADAPTWATAVRVEKILDHIQMVLEWDIRKIQVYFYNDNTSFMRQHSLGSAVIAVSRKADNTIHLGPKVTATNFDSIFGHELVHIISFQKYKEAIPKWLEEGLANFLAKSDKVDYSWLAKRPFPKDVRSLVHSVSDSAEKTRYNYMASQALVEMISSKCDLANLLRLSVGRNMESYLQSYCEIPDLNAAFHAWIKKKSGA